LSVLDIRRMRLHNSEGSTRNILRIIASFFRAEIIHIHISRKLKRSLAILARMSGKKLVYTHHNERNLKEKSTLQTMRLAHQVILVRDFIAELPPELHSKCRVIPAYIPDVANLPLAAALIPFFEEKHVILSHCFQNKNKPLLVDQKDLYGFDLILDSIEWLMKAGAEIKPRLLLLDPADAMEDFYAERINALRNKYNLSIRYMTEDINLASLLKYSRLFIRATRSDGDAVSVREALQCGTTVIASDCVERPEGVRLFSSGDVQALAKCIQMEWNVENQCVHEQADFAPEIFKFYKSL
jgi:glycosyltransferase involved in cell wall biosynthesis